MEEDKKVQTTLRWDAAFHERIRVKVAQRRLRSIQQAVDEAVEQWLKAGQAPKAVAAGEPTEWHAKLTEILASGDEATINAVTQNIDVFHDRLRPVRRKKTG